jgi:hypothetical protein
MWKRTRSRWTSAGVVAAGLVLAGPVAAGAQGTETYRLEGRQVAVYNLAGSVEIVAGSGPDVVARVTTAGNDAGRLNVVASEVGGRMALRVMYPEQDIVYRDLGRGSRTTTRVRSDGTFGDRGEDSGRRVRIQGSGGGMEAWADIRLEVPPGHRVNVYLAVGEADARNLVSDLVIDLGAGRVDARGIQGNLSIDTGSGGVTVSGVRGDVNVDTGSGSVRIDDVTAQEIYVDTGSGSVRGGTLTARYLRVDTGSGGIELLGVDAPDVYLDTGSGSVELSLLGDVNDLEVDTGSGSVSVSLPEGLGAEIEVETGSGGIDLDFPVQVRTMKRNHVEGIIGDGRGRIVIDTGSGGVRLIRR